MAPEALLTLATIFGCLIGLAQNRYPPEMVLVAGVVLLMFADVIEVPLVLEGFANEGMITVAVLYVVANGLTQTGAVSLMSQSLLGKPKSITAAQFRLMLPVSIMSSVLNNTPVVAMLVPAVKDWAKRYQLSVSQLMIPLSYAAIVGGSCTLVGTSTNLVINGMLTESLPEQGLQLFELAWVGIPLVIATLIYTMLVSRWLLPNRVEVASPFEDTRQYVVEMVVEAFSPLIGKSVGDAGLRNLPGAFLVEIQRRNRLIPAVTPDEVLFAEDRLVFAGNVESMVDLKKILGLRSAEQQVFKIDADTNRCLVEVVVSPQSPLLGMTVRDGKFRSLYDAAIIAVAREGERIRERIGDIELKTGDTLLLEAHSEFIEKQRYSREFLLVSEIENSQPIRHERRTVSIVLLFLMVASVSFGLLSMFKAAVFTAAALMATGCVNFSETRKIIQWDVLMVIVASIALGNAVQSSGAGAEIAKVMVSMGGASPSAVLVMFFILTSAFSAIISNLAAAVLMFPIALASSQQLEVSVTPMAITLMVAASTSFSTPIGYQTNLMVYGPGDYKFMDYVKMGTPLTILVGIITVLLVPIIWPFY